MEVRRMKKALFSVLTLLLALSLAACSSEETNSSGTDKPQSTEEIEQKMVMNMLSEPPALDPAMATDTTSGWVLEYLFEGLYTTDENGDFVLGAASDVKVSEDGKTYTFTIRDDAKWSDGDPVTAYDFEYAWERVLNPDTGSRFAFYMYYIKGAEQYNKGEGALEDVGISAPDEKTFVVELKAPTGFVKSLFSFWVFFPVKQEVVEKNSNWAGSNEGYVGNGAYKMSNWKHDSELTLQKNEHYWNKDVITMETVNWTMINEASTYYQMYKTGELDLIHSIPTDVMDQERENEEFFVSPYFGTQMFLFNIEKEPFTNEKVRRAFNLVVNRQAIVDHVLKGGEEPAYAFVPQGVATPSGEDFREQGGYYFEEDVEKAQQLLQEAKEEEGWDKVPAVTLMYNTSETNKRLSEAVQEMLTQNLDVEITLANQEWGTYLDTVNQRNYQMARMGWIGVFLDPTPILDYFLGDSPNNRTQWVNEDYDNYMSLSKVEQDEAKRMELMHKAEDELMKDLPFLPISHYTLTYLTSPNFEGIVYPPNRYPNVRWAEKVSN
jgi:oligopeptide transport system substrate-binding protein